MQSGKNIQSNKKELVSTNEVAVRFSEVDAMGVVWHGNYIKYLEDGRDAFGQQFDLDFVRIYCTEGYLSPLVNVNVDYKRPLKLGDKAIVESTFVETQAAKVIFRFKIFRHGTGELVTTAETTQVFVKDGELSITIPAFFEEWKNKWLK